MKWHALTIFIYAVIVLIGGVMGFVKAHSQMSLIMASGTGALLLIASLGVYKSQNWGLTLGFAVTGLLMFFFGYRYFTTSSFFPAGMMTALSVATLLCLSFLPKR